MLLCSLPCRVTSPPRPQADGIMTEAARHLEIAVSTIEFSPALATARAINAAAWQAISASNLYSKPTRHLAKSPSMPTGIYAPDKYISTAPQE